MAKKKKDIIAENLNALNPGIPTRTRYHQRKTSESGKSSKEISQNSPGPDFRSGFEELIRQNISGAERIRDCCMELPFKIQADYMAGWRKLSAIFCEISDANFRFLIERFRINR